MKHLYLIILLIITRSAFSQTSLNAGGGTAVGTSGEASYSVGQLTTATLQSGNGTVFQGIQMYLEVSIITETPEGKSVHLAIDAYPNPVINNLILSIGGELPSQGFYLLTDNQGSRIQEVKIDQNKTIIDMSNLASGVYYLTVSAWQENSQKTIKTFKIVKTL